MGTSKKCTKCRAYKPLTDFCKRSESPDGLNYKCRKCDSIMSKSFQTRNSESVKTKRRLYKKKNQSRFNELEARRRASIRFAVPAWSEVLKIKKVYSKAKALMMEVDHIIPILNENVCGLHCWHNLQLLDHAANSSKGNRHWPNMWGEAV